MKIGDKKSLKISATLYQVNPGKIHRLKYRIPQIQVGLLYTLTYTSKLTVKADEERNITTKEMI
jgi:hypothetical protein